MGGSADGCHAPGPGAGSGILGGDVMHLGRDGWRFVGASLALVLGVALAAGEEPADAKSKATGWGWWPSWGKSEEKEKPPEPMPVPAQVKKAESEEYHRTVYFRRELVCDRLTEIALQTGDEELARQADKLRDRAWAIYLERSGLKPGTFGGQVTETSTPTTGEGVNPLLEEGE